jgi:hypothetical protein
MEPAINYLSKQYVPTNSSVFLPSCSPPFILSTTTVSILLSLAEVGGGRWQLLQQTLELWACCSTTIVLLSTTAKISARQTYPNPTVDVVSTQTKMWLKLTALLTPLNTTSFPTHSDHSLSKLTSIILPTLSLPMALLFKLLVIATMSVTLGLSINVQIVIGKITTMVLTLNDDIQQTTSFRIWSSNLNNWKETI